MKSFPGTIYLKDMLMYVLKFTVMHPRKISLAWPLFSKMATPKGKNLLSKDLRICSLKTKLFPLRVTSHPLSNGIQSIKEAYTILLKLPPFQKKMASSPYSRTQLFKTNDIAS